MYLCYFRLKNSVETKQQTVTVNTSSPPKPCEKKKNFVFIKTHKSGSTTLIAPMQKFAYKNDLYMVVPSMDHNVQLGWPYNFVPLNNIVMPPQGKNFQALVNHVVYNRTVMDSIMEPKTTYITVVRDPKPHLLSTYIYFGLNEGFKIGYDPEAFEKFLNDTKRYDSLPEYMIKMGMDNVHIKSMTRNLQSADLGLENRLFDNPDATHKFIEQIEREFDFILILERLAESLVLMKRKMCWSMQEIIRINKNRRPQNWGYDKINPNLAQNAYAWNNVDSLLYNMAQKKLNNMRKGEKRLNEEIALYNKINANVLRYCAPMDKWNTTTLKDPEPLIVEKSDFNEQFEVDREFCVLLLLHEDDFTFLFKCKQYPDHRQCKEKISHLHELYSLLRGA